MSPDTKLPLEELRAAIAVLRPPWTWEGSDYDCVMDDEHEHGEGCELLSGPSINPSPYTLDMGDYFTFSDTATAALCALVNHADALLSAAEERDALKRRVEEEKPHLYCAPDCDSLRDGGGYCTCADGWWAERMAFKARAEKAEAALAELRRLAEAVSHDLGCGCCTKESWPENVEALRAFLDSNGG